MHDIKSVMGRGDHPLNELNFAEPIEPRCREQVNFWGKKLTENFNFVNVIKIMGLLRSQNKLCL